MLTNTSTTSSILLTSSNDEYTSFQTDNNHTICAGRETM